MPRCRDCHGEILWAKTEYGKNMPFDAEPSASGSYKLIEGAPLTASHVKPQNRELEPVLHTAHWSTCPEADKSRPKVAPSALRYLPFALCPECGRKFTGVLSTSRCGDCLQDRDRVVPLVEARLEKAT